MPIGNPTTIPILSHDHSSAAAGGSALVPVTLTMPAANVATQAQMEAETTGPRLVPANLFRNSPAAVKAWCHWQADGTLDTPSFNIASITDVGVGNRSIVINTDFSTAVFAIAFGDESQSGPEDGLSISALAAGSFTVNQYTTAAAAEDRPGSIQCSGDQ